MPIITGGGSGSGGGGAVQRLVGTYILGAAGALGSTNMFAVRVYVPSSGAYSKYGFTVGVQSGNMMLAVYNATTLAVVSSEASFATPGAGRQTRTITGGPLTLASGDYFLAIQSDNGTATYALAGNTNTILDSVYTPTNTFGSGMPATLTATQGNTAPGLVLIV